ncbi:hypothetical protein CCACVL1_19637, partial [Corchorus capsularis]
PRGSNQSPPGYPTSVPVSLLLGKMGSVFTQPGLRMSTHHLPSAQPMKIISTMKRVVVSVKIPAAPNIAHLQCTSSACTFHLNFKKNAANLQQKW